MKLSDLIHSLQFIHVVCCCRGRMTDLWGDVSTQTQDYTLTQTQAPTTHTCAHTATHAHGPEKTVHAIGGVLLPCRLSHCICLLNHCKMEVHYSCATSRRAGQFISSNLQPIEEHHVTRGKWRYIHATLPGMDVCGCKTTAQWKHYPFSFLLLCLKLG